MTAGSFAVYGGRNSSGDLGVNWSTTYLASAYTDAGRSDAPVRHRLLNYMDTPETRPAKFDTKWATDYPSIVQSGQRNWPRIIPFFDYPVEIRK